MPNSAAQRSKQVHCVLGAPRVRDSTHARQACAAALAYEWSAASVTVDAALVRAHEAKTFAV